MYMYVCMHICIYIIIEKEACMYTLKAKDIDRDAGTEEAVS